MEAPLDVPSKDGVVPQSVGHSASDLMELQNQPIKQKGIY